MSDADRQPTGGDGALLPAIDFSTFVMSLSHSVLVNLGDAPDTDGEQRPHLELARQTIDLLALLQEKTRNNLSGPEEHLLEQALTDLRRRYVEVSRAK